MARVFRIALAMTHYAYDADAAYESTLGNDSQQETPLYDMLADVPPGVIDNKQVTENVPPCQTN